jgi:hypothetical protein
MLKKTILLFIAFLLFQAGKSFAKSEVSIWGGYHSLHMNSINDRMASDFLAWDILGFDIKRDEIKGSTILGLDYLFDFNETLSIGPRLSFLFIETGNFETKNVPILLKLAGIDGTMSEEMKIFMVPITIGGKYNIENLVVDKCSIDIKGFVGLGIIKVKDSKTITGNLNGPNLINLIKTLYTDLPENFTLPSMDMTNSDWNIDEILSCFVLDCSLGLRYDFSKVVGIFFDMGYLFTPETKIQSFKFDFSGMQCVGGLKFKF